MNAKDNDGWTPLIYAAASTDNPEILKALLAADAQLDARGEYGWTPLIHASALNKNPEIVTTLLRAGADGKLTSTEGKTAFDYAAENPNVKDSEAYWLLNEARF